jgi:hypothetical protein
MSTTDMLTEALADAKALAWDGCHKIYLLMDDEQVEQTRGYGYGSGDGDSELVAVTDPAVALDTLREWWDESCGLRFINTIRTVEGDANEGFDDIIAQCEEWVE